MNKKYNFLFMILILIFLLISCNKKNDDLDGKITSNPILNNNIFKVNMPDKFSGLYETEVDDNSIDFYDIECKTEGYIGYVFGIAAYKNSSDWAGGPIEKVGELSLKNGELYDIVIIYPTETQFGFDREMPDKYKNLYEARFEITESIESNDGNKIMLGAGTKGEYIYKDIINKHLLAINENWDTEHLANENMSIMYALMSVYNENPLNSIGYFYKDINVDGIDELLIGEIADGAYSGIVYDIYTMVDRSPKHVVSGADRDRYYILDNGFILNEYSNGAEISGSNVYNLQTNSTELFLQFAFKYDENENKDNPYFISYDSSDSENKEWQNVSIELYEEMEDRTKEHFAIDYIPFSENGINN